MGILLRVVATIATVAGVVAVAGGRTDADTGTMRPAPRPAAPTATAPTTTAPTTTAPTTRTTPRVRRIVLPSAARAAGAARTVDPAAAVGVSVVDRRTGARTGYDADRPFFSASLVKLLIAVDALRRSADPDLAEQVRYMLAYSDDDTANHLWLADGGTDIVRRMATVMGLRHTVPPDRPGMWGATALTADDVARIYGYLLDRLAAGPRAVVLGALRASRPYGSDGFAQHFGIPDAVAATPHAVKQGWMHYAGQVDLHTSGLVGAGDRYVVVVLTAHPDGTSWASARAAVTAAVRALNLSR